ncbi:MAG: GNAT family N-acetyltransferase [Acholeplasmataceae bacterium]|nr:GNAT family N-acetyltransferase [Acholeplasmataceae bacterium]
MQDFNPIIQTKRLILRPFRYSDIDSIHLYASNLEITKYMLFGPNTYEETSSFVHLIIETWYKESPIRHYEMVVEKDGTVLGAVSIHLAEDLLEGEMGWISHQEFWGKGYITEAALALKEFAIIELKVKKLIAHCDSRNISSMRVMEKIGLKKAELTKNVRRDKKSGEYIYDELRYELLIES